MGDNIREDAIYTSYLASNEGKQQLYDYEVKKVLGYDRMANYNYLTGLPVLRLFNMLAGDVIKANPDRYFSVIMMDISQFKAVNEFLGRAEGDRLLRFIGDTLKEYVDTRPLTVAGHGRADNFVLFTAYEDKKELADVALDIKKRVKELPFAYRVIISFGICASREVQPSVSYLRDCANIALSKVKGKYYADYIFFEEEMRSRMLREKLLESEMMCALDSHQIMPYIQPKVDMVTGRVIGGEALTRWIHPKHGIVGPNEFIPIVESNGLIINIDRFMWKQVFDYQKRLMQEGRELIPISVNVSRMHIYDSDLCDTILGIQESSGVPAKYVPLELTESAFSPYETEMRKRMSQMRGYGFTISMDDFGSGYSSLNMLKASDTDEIKIDKEFMINLENEDSKVVIRHLLALLKDLKKDIIVEGVETGYQRDFLVENGCNRAQGFLYYKPMPLDDFDALMRRG